MSNLKNNIIYNIAYQILYLIVPIVTAPYISRVLGAEGMGLYSYTYSIAHYFVLFCMLGVLNYGNREISMSGGNKQYLSEKFWEIYLNQAAFGIISLFIYFLFVNVFVEENRLIYNLQALYIVSGIMDISWFYFGIERFKVTTSISSINKILTTILIFVLVKEATDVWMYTLIITGGTLLNNVFYWLILNKHIERVKLNYQKALIHLKPLLLLFIPVVAINVYKYIDKIMLGAILDVREVGIFEAAEKLTNIPVCFITAIGTVMLPRISNMVGSNDTTNILRYNRLSLNLVMFLACGMAFGLIGISNIFVPLFYGEEFSDAAIVLVYLCPCILFVSWANVIRTQYLLPYRKDVLFCASVIAGAIVNVISNIVLIKRYGAVGAAIGTLMAEIIVCVIQCFAANKNMNILASLKSSMIYIIIGVIMYMAIIQIGLKTDFLTIIIRILVGGAIYILLSIFFIRRLVLQNRNSLMNRQVLN